MDSFIWPCLNYVDAKAAIAFLGEAFGFVPALVVADGPAVRHAELRLPSGAGVMLGSADPDGTAFQRLTGGSGVYVVTAEPDALHARALAAGAVEVVPLTDTDYGSRTFTVADPEGNLWSFGTYAGEPPG